MSDKAGENQMQGRARGAFLLVNTMKLAVIFGLLPLTARLVFGLNRLNFSILGFTFFVLILSSIAGFGASLIEWNRIEKRTAGGR
ncbi:MAG TPA: hypothetical protein VN920_06840 [Pyrinomonadaceae bacterium]|nr:hypothetical protein [Pyrinomonadaceae bacterium]